jgi:hypothetical protein
VLRRLARNRTEKGELEHQHTERAAHRASGAAEQYKERASDLCV